MLFGTMLFPNSDTNVYIFTASTRQRHISVIHNVHFCLNTSSSMWVRIWVACCAVNNFTDRLPGVPVVGSGQHLKQKRSINHSWIFRGACVCDWIHKGLVVPFVIAWVCLAFVLPASRFLFSNDLHVIVSSDKKDFYQFLPCRFFHFWCTFSITAGRELQLGFS